MKVILLQDIEKLGKAQDIVEVKDGFARNYLIPKGKAIIATPQNIARLEAEKKKRLKHLEDVKKQAIELARRLDGLSINVAVEVHDEDELYGSVTAQDISKALAEEGFDIDKKSIILETPIKKLGVFDCVIRLHPEVEAKIKVWVVKR